MRHYVLYYAHEALSHGMQGSLHTKLKEDDNVAKLYTSPGRDEWGRSTLAGGTGTRPPLPGTLPHEEKEL